MGFLPHGRFARTMDAMVERLVKDIDEFAQGDSALIRNLTSRPIGDFLRLSGDVDARGAHGLSEVDASPLSAARVSAPSAFARLPEPEHVRIHTDNWRQYSAHGRRDREDAEMSHDTAVSNLRARLRQFGLSDDLAHPALPGTPEFDRMLDSADSDLFIYVVRSENYPVIVPERIDTRRFNHAGLILRADDTVTAAGEVRISGRTGDYVVPDLNNRSGAFTPPPGTLSASALPAMERYGLFPQQITALTNEDRIGVVYPR